MGKEDVWVELEVTEGGNFGQDVLYERRIFLKVHKQIPLSPTQT